MVRRRKFSDEYKREAVRLAPLYFRLRVTAPLIALGYASQIVLNIRRTRKAREIAR